jgi:hypothetical protein
MSEAEQQEQRDEQRRPKFDGTVNLGHMLTAFSMLCGGLFVWGQSREVQAKQDVRLSVVEQAMIDQRDQMRKLAETQSLAIRTQDRLVYAVDSVIGNKANPLK